MQFSQSVHRSDVHDARAVCRFIVTLFKSCYSDSEMYVARKFGHRVGKFFATDRVLTRTVRLFQTVMTLGQ